MANAMEQKLYLAFFFQFRDNKRQVSKRIQKLAVKNRSDFKVLTTRESILEFHFFSPNIYMNNKLIFNMLRKKVLLFNGANPQKSQFTYR